MDLDFTEDQEELRRSVRAFLAAECPLSLVREVIETGQPAQDLWRSMQKLDWPALVVTESHGGIGGGPAELAILAEEVGRSLAPVPLLSTVGQLLPVIAELGSAEQREHFERGVAEEGTTGALALVDHPASWDPADVATSARRRGAQWVLNGEKLAVTAGQGVDELAVVARVDGDPGSARGLAVFLVPGTQVQLDVRHSLDASQPLCSVSLEGVEVDDGRALGIPGECGPGLRRALDIASLSVTFETVGTCEVLFELTRQHALDRHQFGVPIGSFQAIKHKLTDAFVSLSRARSLALYAVAALEEDGDERAVAVSMAKAASDDCQRLMCQHAIQTLGGIGFTWEHDAHLYVKRAKTCGALFGNGVEHRRRVAAALGLPISA